MKRAPNRAGHAAGCSAASLGSRFRVPLTDKNKTRTSCNLGTKSRRAPDRTQRSNAPRERCGQRKKEVRNPISGCSYEPERKLAVQQTKKKCTPALAPFRPVQGLVKRTKRSRRLFSRHTPLTALLESRESTPHLLLQPFAVSRFEHRIPMIARKL